MAITLTSGNDTYQGGATDDTIRGIGGKDTIYGGAGHDSIDGGAGGDSLFGEAGNDTLLGMADADYLSGGADNDSLLGGGANDTLQGGDGDDTALGEAADDNLIGGSGNDSLDGGGGNDLVNGGAGGDTLVGAAGNDILIGGAGDDDITPGTGNDEINVGDGTNLIHMTGSMASSTVTFGSDAQGAYARIVGPGDTDIVRGTATLQFEDGTVPVCFYPGTLIATPVGEVPVEALKPGDLVLTTEGTALPVRWMGRQTVSTRFADPLRALPVRVKAGALAEAVPTRDLLLSPGHALLVEGVLVQAGAMVNGASILREAAVPEVFTYWHIELGSHALVLADGAPAETFVDNVEREAFDNWAEYAALAGEAAAPVPEMDLPRAKSHRQVPPAVRARLRERAEALAAQEGPEGRPAVRAA